MLNAQQKKAVETTEGRVLVLAGAGSGKTRVIIHRIVHLIEKREVQPSAILGLTFTNKAAREMKERIGKMLDAKRAKEVTLSTFHSFCMQILRKEIHRLGYTADFTLYDEGDMKRLLKQLARSTLEHEGEMPSLEPVAAKIAQARASGAPPDDKFSNDLYERLHGCLRAYNAVDFDSLLSLTVELFEKHPEVKKLYQFRYIMIDEYQDTSPIQYRLAELLAEGSGNLCVVGDDDQSIYGWRGAEVKNILQFPHDTLIRLQQNYRSLPPILKAANHLIAHNTERHDKELVATTDESQPIVLFHAPTAADEAAAVVQRMLYLRSEKGLRWRDFAILYRSNALSQLFEMALIQAMWQEQKTKSWKRGIPYAVFGGTELYERSEVKDLMAYLRVVANSRDEEALLRIINVPRRGISDKTLGQLTSLNRTRQIPLWHLLEKGDPQIELPTRAQNAIHHFVLLIQEARHKFANSSLKEAFTWLIEAIEYKNAIEEEVQSDKARLYKWENVQNCINALGQYEEESENPSLIDFLSTTMLDQSYREEREEWNDAVNLMTFHSAKGLEFEACFLIGLEDPIIPHEKSVAENRLEEERRLLYVAITRAKKFLTLSMARTRMRYGKEDESSPSRFLFEIPKELLRVVSHRHPF